MADYPQNHRGPHHNLFFIGLSAFFIFDYSTQFAETDLRLLMRPTTHPLVMAGPLFQPIRGFLFGIAFFLLRDFLFGKPRGWLTLWIVLVIIGILSTFGPAPGSIVPNRKFAVILSAFSCITRTLFCALLPALPASNAWPPTSS